MTVTQLSTLLRFLADGTAKELKKLKEGDSCEESDSGEIIVMSSDDSDDDSDDYRMPPPCATTREVSLQLDG